MTVANPLPTLWMLSLIPAIIIVVLLHGKVFKKYSKDFWQWLQTIISFLLLEFVILPFIVFWLFELILG